MRRQREEVLRDALAHFEVMLRYAERDTNDQLVVDAICMRRSAGLEVLSGLDPVALTELFGDRWPLMWGMRNRIAHGYLLVNSAIVRQTIDDDVPPIIATIRGTLT